MCIASSLLLAWSLAAAMAPEPLPWPALEFVPEEAKVRHCGVSQGVLHVTYVRHGRETTAPAFHTPAIRSACAAAGHALPSGPRARLAAPIAAPRIGAVPAQLPAPRLASEPSFMVRAGGGGIRIDGRNDGEVALHCLLDFSWTADNEPGGSRAVTAQVALPARQSNQVLFIATAQAHPRMVGLPRWNCQPGG